MGLKSGRGLLRDRKLQSLGNDKLFALQCERDERLECLHSSTIRRRAPADLRVRTDRRPGHGAADAPPSGTALEPGSAIRALQASFADYWCSDGWRPIPRVW